MGNGGVKENTADLGIKSNMGAVNNTKKDQCMKADITGHKKRRVCDCKPSLLKKFYRSIFLNYRAKYY